MAIALPWIPPIHLGRDAPGTAALAQFAGNAATAARPCTFPSPSFSTADPSLLPRHGWMINESRQRIGRGHAAYARAARALEALECCQLNWLTAHMQDGVLAICSRQLGGVWVMNANLILRRESQRHCSSVTFRTTTRHLLAGEERLAVTWDETTDDVHFEVLSFSRPRHALSWLSYPYVLYQQRRFARDATTKMAWSIAYDSISTGRALTVR